MRKLLVGLPVALLLAHGVQAATCGDTTVVITASPYNTSSLNTVISNCDDSTMVITLDASGAGAPDTIRFTNEIIVTSRPAGSSTAIVGKGKSNGPLIINESNVADPLLFDIKSPDKTTLSNFTVVRKADASSNHSIAIAAKGSIVRDCHLFRFDNGSVLTSALISITADSVLVERCLFRTPPGGKGRGIAITTSGSAQKNEYRSNIFYGTGLYLTAGSHHIFANTFAGSRDDYNAIIVGSGVANPGTAVNIQHNLFALKDDFEPPVFFAGAQTSADSIIKNAYTKSRPTMALAVNNAQTALTLNNTAGSNANVVLDQARGFSRYASHVTEFKEYPLVTLRTDETLSRSHADFGKIPRVYSNTVSTWTTMPDISSGLPSNKLYFSANGNTFTPFIGTSWGGAAGQVGTGIKVGALVDLEARITPPSPLDSGLVNKGLVITRYASDSTKMRVTNINFNRLWYDTTIPPAEMLFFFSTSQSKLAANDSNALKNPTTGTPYYTRRSWLAFDSILAVPKEVRVSGNPIFVKMLHYNAGGQAAAISAGTIAQVTGIPGFPINDLGVPVLDASSDTLNGRFVMTVAKNGSESIDSITVTVLRAGGGGTQTSLTKGAVAQGASASFTFDLPSGSFQFVAAPVAKVGASNLTGSLTNPTRAISSRSFVGSIVYVANSATGCAGKTGTVNSPFCTIDTALAVLATKNGGTIVVKNGTPALPFQDLAISGSDSSLVTITADTVSGAFDPAHRAVFRGSAGTPAITVTRKNITLRGFIIEMPAGSTSPGVTVTAGASGTIVDGCLFRPTSKAAAGGPAISIENAGNGEARFISNVVWGFTTAVRINSASTAIRVLHNTFIDESSVNTAPTIGISAPSSAMNAVVANNFFSGIDTAFGANVAGKSPKLDHNIYTVPAPFLQGQSELGGLDNVPRLADVDLTAATWAQIFQLAMETLTDCSAVRTCYTLYAGSSTDTYGQAIATDVMGKTRKGKVEVGALEADASSTSVRGVLTMAVTPMAPSVQGGDTKMPFLVTRKTYDPADADSVHVWWSTGNNAELNNTILAAYQKHYPIGMLASGTLSDTATGLDGLKSYTVYAALGKTSGGTRVLGYGYRATATTPSGFTLEDCTFGLGNSVCPVKSEVFSVKDGDNKDKYFTKVRFALPDTGGVKVPEFNTVSQIESFSGGKVEIISPLPRITLSVEAALTKVPGSLQKWTAQIRMVDDPGDILKDKELFILPSDPGGLPTYVSSWTLRREGPDAWLDIEGTESGTFVYAFGQMSQTASAGTVTMTNPADQPPRFSFTTAAENDSVPITIRGTGFATSNPLIMITPISAGGTYPNPMGTDLNPRNELYPNKSLFITSDLADLHENLRKDRFFQYYQMAVSADAAAPAPVGMNKAFNLAPVGDVDAFMLSSVLTTPSIAVSGAGESGEISLHLPINTRYKEAERYPDTVARTTRSIEVVFTTFDGSRISRTSGFIRTEFSDVGAKKLHNTEKEQFTDRTWNLFSYPWDEADTGSLARIFNPTAAWSKDEFRLMKYKGTGAGAGSFIAYDGSNAASITFDAGKAAWSGSRNYYTPSSASGISLDYKPFTLSLSPGVWNDIGLPFNFSIKWRDILNASKLRGDEFKVWRFSPKSGSIGPGWAALTGKDVVHPWEGLTVHPVAPTDLIFPVMDSSRSATPLEKAGASTLWTAGIRAYNETAHMNLRIGKGSREAVVTEAPDVPGQDFRVGLARVMPDGRQGLSEYIQAGEDWRGHWALTGKASKSGIRLAVGENEGETPIYLVELLSRKSVLLAPGAEATLSQEDLATGDYHLVAGDSRYLQDILDGMVPLHMLALSNYPNPFSGTTMIRYALPETFGKVAFKMRIRDSQGRLVWEKVQRGSNSLRYLWDGRDNLGKTAPSGFYTLTLEATAPGKATQRAVSRLLKM